MLKQELKGSFIIPEKVIRRGEKELENKYDSLLKL